MVGGATELTADEREQLDRRGFVLLPGVLPPAQVAAMRNTLDDLAAEAVAGAEEIANLQNVRAAGAAFDVCLTHPRVLSAVRHVLGERVATLGIHARTLAPSVEVEKTYREALHTDYSGHLHPDGTMHLSAEGLVIDSATPAPRGSPYHTCNTHWLLSDFTVANGATRCVPGTHKCGAYPHSIMDEDTRRESFPSEHVITGPAGSVIVWNGHVWHSATLNTSPAESRHSVTSFFGSREWADQEGQRFRDGEAAGGVGMLGRACLERLSAEHRRFYTRSPPPQAAQRL